MERGALGSELDGNPAERRAIWSREDSRFVGTVVTLHRQQCGMPTLIVPLYCCNYSNTSYLYNSVFLSRYVLSCTRVPARSLPLLSKRCSFREGGLCELAHCGRCLFGEGSNALIVRSSTPSGLNCYCCNFSMVSLS